MELGSIHRAECAPRGQAGREECQESTDGRRGLAGKLSSEGVAHVQLKPVQETNFHFLYFMVFFRLLKRKKILKRENDKKKKILVHEIKIFFFYNLVLIYVDLLGREEDLLSRCAGGVPQTPARKSTTGRFCPLW